VSENRDPTSTTSSLDFWRQEPTDNIESLTQYMKIVTHWVWTIWKDE